ncbi:MAG: hypothetical protein OEW58_09360, partial [Gammaproteobacteria bacterium]|nr:hypothetical protein [Gammaproteobacteria bacterium]
GADWSLFNINSPENDRINGWANYRYLDAANNVIYEGEINRDGSGAMDWRKMLPNNVELGKTYSFSMHHEWMDWDSATQTQVPATSDVTVTVMINRANNTDGTPAVMKDLLGKKIPVMKVNVSQSETRKVGTQTQTDGGKTAFYIVQRYGVEGAAHVCAAAPANNDETSCPTQDWETALADVRFGIISPDKDMPVANLPAEWAGTVCNPLADATILANTVCMTTPTDLVAGTGGATPMPSYDVFGAPVAIDTVNHTFTANMISTGLGVKTVRDSWLGAMAKYINEIDRRQDNNSNRGWFYINFDANGKGVEPASWDPVTNKSYSLLAATAFVIDTEMDGVATGGVPTNYAAFSAPSLDATSTFHYAIPGDGVGGFKPHYMTAEAKYYDPTASCSDGNGNTWTGCDVPFTSGGVSGNYVELLDPIADGNRKHLAFSFNLPVVNTTNYKQVWINWEESAPGSGIWQPYCASNVSIWFSMAEKVGAQVDYNPASTETDDVHVTQNPVGWYMVRNATPITYAPGDPMPDVATACAAPAI